MRLGNGIADIRAPIGLNLGTAGKEFATLYPVLVFHQSFEGLRIGARLSAAMGLTPVGFVYRIRADDTHRNRDRAGTVQ